MNDPQLNRTHRADVLSWVASANLPQADFPLQNLPFGVFSPAAGAPVFRGGVAIGDQVLDLPALYRTGLLHGLAARACEVCRGAALNGLMGLGATAWQALRFALFDLFSASATPAQQALLAPCLVPQDQVVYRVPARIGDYTDFYTSLHHARNAGALVRPEQPLPPNFQWLPLAYHGRSSSIGVSGQGLRRPLGQTLAAGTREPQLGPSERLDYELELGIFIGPGNQQGQRVALANAERHVFGLCLLNDWSARDIQFWEMAPLGPFLGKNFATTVSPWIVTLEALAPFRRPWQRPDGDPQPLAYLDSEEQRTRGALDIQLSAAIETEAMRRAGAGPAIVSRTSFVHQYWSVAQMVAQHTVGGCNLRAGDLLGSGTVSGPRHEEAGCLLERTRGGREPLRLARPGLPPEERRFLQDGDVVELRGWCEAPGFRRIGFGSNRGEVLPALWGDAGVRRR